MTNVVPHYVEVGDLMSPNTKREKMGKKWLVVGLTTHANKLIFLCVDQNNDYETFEVEKMRFHSLYAPEPEKPKAKKEGKNGNTNSDTNGTGDSGVQPEGL